MSSTSYMKEKKESLKYITMDQKLNCKKVIIAMSDMDVFFYSILFTLKFNPHLGAFLLLKLFTENLRTSIKILYI